MNDWVYPNSILRGELIDVFMLSEGLQSYVYNHFKTDVYSKLASKSILNLIVAFGYE